jgi:hypothetical protein
MVHLDIYNTSYGKKKGQESNWQFDSQPLKIGNQLDLGVCSWSATHCWKTLKENYKFALDLIPIGGLSKKLWSRKVPRVQTRTVSGLLLGNLETKKPSGCRCHGETQVILYGGSGGFPQVRAVVSLVNPGSPMACPSTKGAPESELTNLLVGLMQVRVSN